MTADDKPAPRFRIGQSVRDTWGTVGKVAAIYDSLAAAEAAEVITDAEAWLAAHERPPRTARNDYWYRVKPARGALLCGQDDLDPVDP